MTYRLPSFLSKSLHLLDYCANVKMCIVRYCLIACLMIIGNQTKIYI